MPYLWPMLVVYMAACIGHAMMQWITYMFCYYPGDFLGLACYERYLNVIWIVNAIILVFFILKVIEDSKYAKRLYILVAGVSVVIIGLSGSGKCLIPIMDNNSTLKDFYGEAYYIEDNTPEDSSIFIVTQGDNGYVLSVFRYLTMPRTYNNDDYSFGDLYSESDIWTRNYSKDEFLNIAKNFDYMYLYYVDEQFMNLYGNVLICDEQVRIGNLYRIKYTDELGIYLAKTNSN